MSVTIRPMTFGETRRHLGRYPWPMHAYIMKAGRRIVAMGGLIWRWGRCDLFLDVLKPDLLPRVALIRMARKMLRTGKQFGDRQIFCWRDDHPNSERLLRVVGMSFYGTQEVSFTDGTKATRELWVWG